MVMGLIICSYSILARLTLLLETVLTMPLKKMRMRSVRLSQWRKRAPRLVYKRTHSVLVIRLPRNQDLQVVGQAD
jgi:hypothetical protein